MAQTQVDKLQDQQGADDAPAVDTQAQETQKEEGFAFSFDAVYADVFDGLDATDTADGTNKKVRKLYLVICLLMCIQIVWFAFSRSGIALLFAILLGGMALMLKSKTQRFNREIAQAFVKEGQQTVILKDDCMMLNQKQVAYTEVAKLFDLKRCFSLIYQGNHVYIIPKNVLDEQQISAFSSAMKEKIGAAYIEASK